MPLNTIKNKIVSYLAERGFTLPSSQVEFVQLVQEEEELSFAQWKDAQDRDEPQSFTDWSVSHRVCTSGFTNWPDSEEAVMLELFLYPVAIPEGLSNPLTLPDEVLGALHEPVTHYVIVPVIEGEAQETVIATIAAKILSYFQELEQEEA